MARAYERHLGDLVIGVQERDIAGSSCATSKGSSSATGKLINVTPHVIVRYTRILGR